MRAQKSLNYVADSTVPVTVVPHTVIKEPVFLARGMRRRSGDSRSSTSPLILASLIPFFIDSLEISDFVHNNILTGMVLDNPIK